MTFKSGPNAVAHMLQHMDVQKEIKKHLAIFPTIKSAEQRKKAFCVDQVAYQLACVWGEARTYDRDQATSDSTRSQTGSPARGREVRIIGCESLLQESTHA